MKKIVYTFLCILIGMSIGIPLIYNDDNRLSAAEYTGEKFIDFDFFTLNDRLSTNSSGLIYLITEDHMLMYKERAYDQTTLPLLMYDKNGIPLSNVIKVSGGGTSRSSGIALRDDGKIYAWGDNSYGQFGNGTTSSYSNKAVIVDTGVTDIKSILVTGKTNFLITANGDVYASGDNANGQFGNGTYTGSHTFTKLNIDNIKKITYSYPNTFWALKNDGTVYTWGAFTSNGIEYKENVNVPIQVYAENKTDYQL